jgi:hypothetical protein
MEHMFWLCICACISVIDPVVTNISANATETRVLSVCFCSFEQFLYAFPRLIEDMLLFRFGSLSVHFPFPHPDFPRILVNIPPQWLQT